jgi:LPXTG-site transpeptidase (sortase) family protein
MSQSDIARFHPRHLPSRDNNPDAAHHARKRISELPDTYMAHAAPRKEDLIGEVQPVSPAAEHGSLHISSAAPTPAREPAVRPEATQAPKSKAWIAPATPPAPKPPAAPINPLENQIAKPKPESKIAHKPVVADAAQRRSLPSRLRPFLIGLATFVLLFVIFKAPIFLNQLGYLTAKPKAAAPAVNTANQVGPAPVISIPKVNVNAPIVFADSNVEANIQKDLESGVVHYAKTALPGEPGNAVIFGHSSNDWWEPGSYKFVFVLLDKLVVGDTFTINYNSKQYVYKVVETKVVEPTDLTVLNQTTDPELTLITCTPPGTSWKRLIVRSQQISPAPETASKSAPKSGDTGINGAIPGSSPSWTDSIGKFWHGITGIFSSDKSDK